MYYHSFHEAMQQQFGCKIYKLALDGGMGCPNRDGTCGSRGCIFCSEQGSGDFAAPRCKDIRQQLALARQRVEQKAPNARYIAYFQSFTNTYAPLAYLDRLFTEAISQPEVVALSIATRPDCLPPDTIALLSRLNAIKPVWVELGLQTCNEQTARFLRRGYPLPVFDQAMQALKQAGLTVIVHQILGLPGEDRAQMLQTTRYLADAGADGVKLQLLHILEGTDLATLWRQGSVPVLSLEEYSSILCDCIRILPRHMVIHRLTGDGPKRLLLAPLWSADKKRVLNTIQRTLREQEVCQGAWYPIPPADIAAAWKAAGFVPAEPK